jgi:hypothetical protein
MVRIGLSLYLMLAAAAGPWLCCCTTERLAARFAFPTKQSSHNGCCGDHQTAKGSQKHRTPEQSPSDEDQPGCPSCPCQEEGARLAVLASLDSSEVAKEFQSRHIPQGLVGLVPLVPTAHCLSADGDPETSGEAVRLPFLSAQDILHALHILRC